MLPDDEASESVVFADEDREVMFVHDAYCYAVGYSEAKSRSKTYLTSTSVRGFLSASSLP